MVSQPPATRKEARSPLVWPAAALLAVGATALALGVQAVLAVPDLEMLYLLAILVSAVLLGRGPSLVTAALSVAAYDYFFVLPFHTFAVADVRYLLTFAMMFGIGLGAGTLAERVRREERAAAAAEVRAQTEELRSSLLSSVSHDLRTPLAAITGAASALSDPAAPLPEAQRKELLQSITGEAARLERLVGNLLDMTRLESGGLQPRREWVPLEELVGGALNRLERALAGRPVHIALAPGLPLLHVDPVLIEQALINVLDNAAKHTPAGGAIEIAAQVAGAELEVEVRDRGPGLPPAAGNRLFEKFYRGAPAGGSGAGLGLAICKGIVEAHGGRVSAADRQGGGATFRLTFPLPSEQPS